MHKKYTIPQDILKKDLSSHFNYSDSSLLYEEAKDGDVIDQVQSYIDNNKVLDAEKIIGLIFPLRKPHIFISHKSEHAGHAIKLANILYKKFKIKSFIDSQVWHHIDLVSKMINNKVSKIREDGGVVTYSHKGVSIVASNMFAMLSSSLLDVMDNSDCFLFIENEVEDEFVKISKSNVKELKTKSPWIYLELSYAGKLRSKMHYRSEKIAKDSVNESAAGLEGYKYFDTEFIFSRELVDSREISSLSRVLHMHSVNNDPLYNLDEIYKSLDKDFIL